MAELAAIDNLHSLIPLQGMNVLVTGAGAGIGRGIAQTFGLAGANVYICDNDPVAIEKTLAEGIKGVVNGFVCDVTSESDVDKLFTSLEKATGGLLHVLCANAGSSGPTKRIEEMSLKEWKDCVAVNLDGTYLFCRRAIPMMRRAIASGSKHGCSIIMTSSTAGILGYPFRTPYASAKWGLIGLTKSLAMELGKEGIRCNAICPGAMNNPRMDGVIEREAQATGKTPQEIRQNYLDQNALRTFIDTQDIASMALFCASPLGRKVTGQALPVDGLCDTLASKM